MGTGTVELLQDDEQLRELSPKEMEVYAYLIKKGKSKLIDIARALSSNTVTIAMYCGSLYRYGLLERVNSKTYRITTAKERSLGLALSGREKLALKHVEHLHNYREAITSKRLAGMMACSDVVALRYLRVLYFAGFISSDKRPYMREYKLLKHGDGRVVGKNTYK